jgi:hypothetical protein
VDVRYAGTSLGARTLPIGNDVWAPYEPAAAVGSCSVATGAQRSDGHGWAWLAAGFTALAAASARGRARRRAQPLAGQ